MTGCVSPAPVGPLVEYRAGLTPVTRPVKCPATYVLCAEQPDSSPIAEHHLTKGERVGFRREDDGSVSAVAPGYTIPLPPGVYRWEVMRASVPLWHQRAWCEARTCSVAAGRTTLIVVGVTCVLTALLALGVLYAWAEAESHRNSGNGFFR